MCNVLVRQTQTDRQTETDRGYSFSSQRFRCAARNCTNDFGAQIKIESTVSMKKFFLTVKKAHKRINDVNLYFHRCCA